MSLSSLLSRPMQLVQRDYLGDVDAYGSEIPTTTRTEILGELQQIWTTEPVAAGELSDATWIVFLPYGTLMNTGDAIMHRGDTYEIVGHPWDADSGSPAMWHVEARARRTKSAADEETGS